jgi:antitoxin HicB
MVTPARTSFISHRVMYDHKQGCNTMRHLNYRTLLRKEPEGGYTVTVPTLPGCVTYGETVDEAIAMAREAIELYIEHLQEKGEEIPTEEGLLEYTLTVEAHA